MKRKVCTLEQVCIELPMQVIILIGVAHAYHDVTVEVRSYGHELIGNGVTAGLDHYSATMEQITVDGKTMDCVRLTKRPNFWTGDPGDPIDYLFTYEGLRCAGIDLQIAHPTGEVV